MEYLDSDIGVLAEKLKSGEIVPADLINEAYDRIEKFDLKLNTFITLVDRKVALKKALELTKNKNRNNLPLYGIPFVMKDAYVTKGIRTTAASKILDNYLPQYDSTVYKRLIDKGAILIGKCNMDSWGHGASTENTDYGVTRNPWDFDRTAGGSGGGPAAAISARFSCFAIGEDTGGSIRNPAAWCGITGLKVTYGRVSRYGAIAYASSLDTVGPTAKSVSDLAYVLEVIAGKDVYDSTTSEEVVKPYHKLIDNDIKGKIIAFPTDFFTDALDPEINKTISEAKEVFISLGAKVENVTIPMLEFGVPLYYILAPSETSSNLARYDGIRYGGTRELFTKESQRRIMTGTFALSTSYYDAYYKKALKVRTILINKYKEIFNKYDAILAPVTATNPPKFGELLNDPVKNMMADIYTVTSSIIGSPSLSIPCGFTKSSLPIGMQLIGKMFSEDILMNLGHKYQSNTNWHKQKPKLLI